MMRQDNSSSLSKASLTTKGTEGLPWGLTRAGGDDSAISAGGTSVCMESGVTVTPEDPTSDRARFLFFECVPSRSIHWIVD